MSPGAVAGVADHLGWAVIVVVGGGGTVLDRRRVELIDPGLPPSPFEHEAQDLPLEDAVTLINEVERSVERHVHAAFDILPYEMTAVAIRDLPELPKGVEAQIRSYHAQTRADGAMYRRALADEATQRGWQMHWYEHRHVIDEAVGTLGLTVEHLGAPRRHLGPPWTVDHRRAYAAALLALHDLRRG